MCPDCRRQKGRWNPISGVRAGGSKPGGFDRFLGHISGCCYLRKQGGVMKRIRIGRLGLPTLFQWVFVLIGLVLPSMPHRAQQNSTLRVDVDLVTVEVIAQDKKGNPVMGLKKEDFKLLENGKEQEIVSFDAVTDKPDEVMPASLKDIDDSGRRGKVVLILFDDSNITSAQIQNTRDAAEKYIKEHMRPWDFFAVGSYGLSMKILQNFTHDAAKVVEAIRQPAMSHAEPGLRQALSANSPEQPQIPGQRERENRQNPFGMNPALNQQARFRATALLRTLGQISTSITRVKGRKSVLLFSEDFSLVADAQVELRNAIEAAQRANVAFYSVDAKGLNSFDTNDRGSLDGPSSASHPRREEQGGWLSSLARRVLPSPDLFAPTSSTLRSSFLQTQGGQAGGGQAGGGQAGGGQAGGGQVGGGQAGGGQAGGGQSGGNQSGGAQNNSGFGNNSSDRFGNSNGRQNPFGDDQSRFDQFQQQSMMNNILRSLSSETGGIAVYNTNNLNQGLDKVDLELSNYYVLGFSSSDSKRDGKYRKLKVKTKVKGVRLKHRDGYLDPRPPDALAGSKDERSLMSAISSPTPVTDLPLMFRPSYFYESPQLVRVPITARIQKGAIELKKKGGMLGNEVGVMAVAYAEDGSVAARSSETLNLMVEKEREQVFETSDIPYHSYLKLRPGKYQLKLAVSDEKGKVGTAEQTLTVPPMPSGLATSSLVVSQELAQLPELIKNIQARLLDESDPLIYKGIQIYPPVENSLRRESPAAIFYRLYNVSGSEQDHSLTAKVQLVDDKGQTTEIPPINLGDVASPAGPSEVAVGINLPLKELSPGKYRLTVETLDNSNKQTVTNEADLVLE